MTKEEVLNKVVDVYNSLSSIEDTLKIALRDVQSGRESLAEIPEDEKEIEDSIKDKE